MKVVVMRVMGGNPAVRAQQKQTSAVGEVGFGIYLYAATTLTLITLITLITLTLTILAVMFVLSESMCCADLVGSFSV